MPEKEQPKDETFTPLYKRVEDALLQCKQQPETFSTQELQNLIRELQLHENDMETQNQELRSLFAALTDVVLVLDDEGRYLKLAPTDPMNLYRPSGEILGKKIHEVLPQEAADNILLQIRKTLQGGRATHLEYQLTIGSREVWFDAKVSPLTATTVYWVARDITELKQIEKSLRESEERFRAIFEQAAVGVAQIDTVTGRFIRVNQRDCEIAGLTREQMLATTYMAITHPDDLQADLDKMEELKQGLMRNFSLEKRLLRPDGSIVWVNLTVSPMWALGESCNYHIAIIEDISERKNAELIANRAQRLEAIGTLAGGIAHDLNNALAPIMMGLKLVKIKYPDKSVILETMESSAKRAADMVRQLLSFAKGAEGKHTAIQLIYLIREMEKIITSTFPKNIKLRIIQAQKLPVISGDTTQLHQVLLNLCVNARDAMPEGGTLTVATELVDVDAVFISSAAIPGAKPGRFVALKVTDTGMGIAPEILAKIFDPFFTTKAADKGTGMGLSTVLGIVKGHDGFIQVSSQLGQGTTFAIYLPAQQQLKTDLLTTNLPAEFHGNGELILFVDDELSLRTMANTVLSDLNFTPLTAVDGADGLIQAAQNHLDLRAVITDLHMPQVDGLAFARALRRLLPNIPVIVASGRLEDAQEAEFKELGVHLRLDKPFTQFQLAEALRVALQGS